MSFPRHREIYRPMWPFCPRSLGATTAAAPTHRLDEFPAGYSLAVCSPALPASASPAGNQYALQSFCRSRIFQRTANSVLTVCVSPGGKRKMLRTRKAVANSNWVFPSETDGPTLGTSLDHQHSDVRTALKLPEDFVIHSLRHTTLTRLEKRGPMLLRLCVSLATAV
jgi:hypothetical protein